MKLHYFNPENDIALGLDPARSFTLSSGVADLHNSGAMLPVWYAGGGDAVLVADVKSCQAFLESRCRMFNLDVSVADVAPGADGAPWGWSAQASRDLSHAGASVLSADRVEVIRQLSHRRTSIDILSALYLDSRIKPRPLPVEAFDVETVRSLHEKWGDIYVKQPWSSSGRGVVHISGWTDKVGVALTGMIRRQGSVLVERGIDKRMDFAMLFKSDGSKAGFVGYSLFFNNRQSYAGNLMADDRVITECLIGCGASLPELDAVRNGLENVLSEIIAPVYSGYFGIDMMVDSEGGIVPCVELNLRMTMGVVASIWRRRYLSPDALALFMVGRPEAGIGDDCRIKDFRLQKGRVLLTPPSAGGFVFSVETVSEFKQFLK